MKNKIPHGRKKISNIKNFISRVKKVIKAKNHLSKKIQSKWVLNNGQSQNFKKLTRELRDILKQPISVIDNDRKATEIANPTDKKAKKRKIIVNLKNISKKSRSRTKSHSPVIDTVSKQSGIAAKKLQKLLQKRLKSVQSLKALRGRHAANKPLRLVDAFGDNKLDLSPADENVTNEFSKYTGQSPACARNLLELSQNRRSDFQMYKGHPRAHAYLPKYYWRYIRHTWHQDNCIQLYSMRHSCGAKGAFRSYRDQDIVAHAALSTQQAREAMDVLNDGAIEVVIEIQRADLGLWYMPRMKMWAGGKSASRNIRIDSVKLVLRHFYQMSRERNYPPLVHSFYPINKNRRWA